MSDNPKAQAAPALGRDWLTPFVAGMVFLFIILGAVWFASVRNDYVGAFHTPNQQAQDAKQVAAAAKLDTTARAQQMNDLKAAWGQYGDYLGGVLNPVLAYLSFAALAVTLILQTRQVQLSRQELHEARRDREEGRKDASAQLKATRTLAAAQLRTSRAQERAVALLNRQLEQAAATARAQEHAAQALMQHAQITTLQAQLNQATGVGLNAAAQLHAAKQKIGAPAAELADLEAKRNDAYRVADGLQAEIMQIKTSHTP